MIITIIILFCPLIDYWILIRDAGSAVSIDDYWHIYFRE